MHGVPALLQDAKWELNQSFSGSAEIWTCDSLLITSSRRERHAGRVVEKPQLTLLYKNNLGGLVASDFSRSDGEHDAAE